MRLPAIAAAMHGVLGRVWVLACTLGCVVGGVACSSSTRPGPTPEADAGPDASDAGRGDASLPYPLDQLCAPATDPSLDACGRCARESCCDTRTRVLTDAGNGLIDCLQVDGCDSSCQAACFDKAPAETAPFLEHFSCLSHRCTDCGVTRSPCQVCMERSCLRETVACDLSRDCFVISSCITACRGADACIATCGRSYPGAGSLNGALLVCASNLCARECQ